MAKALANPLLAQLQLALIYLTSSSPHVVQQAQRALLQLKEQHMDEYINSLLSFLTHNDLALHLVTLLALKTTVGLQWKD